MKNNHDEAFVSELSTDVRLKLSYITDRDQRSLLLDYLRRGVEIPEFAWEPIRDFSAKLEMFEHAVESPEYQPSSYWSNNGQPIVGFHTEIRQPYYDVGEYLPELDPREVEIARIVLRSTTGDVISVRARPKGDRIAYSAVDEYETQFKVKPEESKGPLSHEQLINMLEELQVEEETGNYLQQLLNEDPDFLSAHSDFYPGLNVTFEKLLHEWMKEKSLGANDDTDEYSHLCQQCGQTWLSHLEHPDECVSCGSPPWNQREQPDDTSPVSVPVWKRFLNGRTVCEVHNCAFESGLANLAFGLFELKPEYAEAKETLFPHANSWLIGGCVAMDVEVVEVDYCEQCRDAENLWNKARKAL
jgi:hypothetical protein